jgi:site-specific DNA recombinase
MNDSMSNGLDLKEATIRTLRRVAASPGRPPQLCVLYVRVSSREQEEEGFSVPAQLKLLRGYCEAANLKVVKEFIDIESAKNPGARKDFENMLTFLRRNKTIRHAICEKTDRFYRNFRDYVSVDDLGLTLHFPKENVILTPTSNSNEKFMHGIKVLMAKNYLDNLSEEVRKGIKEKCEQGIWPSMAPLGYLNIIRDDKKHVIVIDPVRAPIIRRIFEAYVTGNYSVKDVAKLARQWGLTFRKSGLTTGMATVHAIMRKRIYSGDFDWNGKTYRGIHEPIVSRELWRRVQDILDGRNRQKPKQGKYGFLFAGIITCGYCGCAMVSQRKKGKYVYLNCTGHRGKCPGGYIRQEVMEKQAIRLLGTFTFPDQVLADLGQALRESHQDEKRFRDAAIARLEAEYKTLQNRLDEMYLDKLDGRITAAYHDRKAGEWRGEQTRIEDDIAKHREADRSYIDEGVRVLEVASGSAEMFAAEEDDAEKRELLRYVLAGAVWRDGELSPKLRPPFDLIAEHAARLRAAESSRVAAGSAGRDWAFSNTPIAPNPSSEGAVRGADSAKSEIWLGRQESNLQSSRPERAALPFGHSPSRCRGEAPGQRPE